MYLLRVNLYHGFHHVEVVRGRHSAHDIYIFLRTVKNLLAQVFVILAKAKEP